MHNQTAATSDQQRRKSILGKASKVWQETKELRLASQTQFCHKLEATTLCLFLNLSFNLLNAKWG